MRRANRFRLLIDPKLQGALLCRVVLYWCFCVFVVLVLAGLQTLWASPGADASVLLGRAVLAFGPALIASLIVLPVVLFDALRFSHRFAGPMHRLRGAAGRLADGESLPPVTFRKGDYWGELAEQFNRVSAEVDRLRAAAPAEAGDAPVSDADEDADADAAQPAGSEPLATLPG
ncbi:MAG: hypothetical protein AAF790_14250 [Planctomycetota bacterium]